MSESNKTENRGGARKGAGRKSIPVEERKTPFVIYLQNQEIGRLTELYGSRTEVRLAIETHIRQNMLI